MGETLRTELLFILEIIYENLLEPNHTLLIPITAQILPAHLSAFSKSQSPPNLHQLKKNPETSSKNTILSWKTYPCDPEPPPIPPLKYSEVKCRKYTPESK